MPDDDWAVLEAAILANEAGRQIAAAAADNAPVCIMFLSVIRNDRLCVYAQVSLEPPKKRQQTLNPTAAGWRICLQALNHKHKLIFFLFLPLQMLLAVTTAMTRRYVTG